MKFSHTYTVHSCFECKEYSHTSDGSPNWSLNYLLLGLVCAVPLFLYLALSSIRLPWYHAFGIIAGQLLLLYCAGFVSGLLMLFRHLRPSRCPKCGSLLASAGTYYRTDEKPNSNDAVLFIVFLLMNVAVWILLLTGGT